MNYIKIKITTCFLLLAVAFGNFSLAQSLQVKSLEVTVELPSQEVPVYDFSEFEHLLNMKDGKIYIVNFWATWCKPCVEEMPYFERIGEKYKNKNVEIILVSLDFPSRLTSHVIPFIEKNNIKSRVILLDDTDSNTWIPKVDKNWSGAIPATLIYNKNSRKFYEGKFTYDSLETQLKTFL